MNNTVQPKHFQPGEGNIFKIGRMSMTFRTTAVEGWNAYTVCEAVEPPESGAVKVLGRAHVDTPQMDSPAIVVA